jgi:two-component system alkaline phosphatase synthesis response regulator PhoP
MKDQTKKTILIVEDDTVIVEMYKEKLKHEGFRVLTATDGRIALQRVKENIDLILLDILMPKLNGFEVLKRLKNDKKTSSIPVIVLTNIGSESIDNDKKLAFSLGAADYMIKSLNTPNDVVAKVRAIFA